MQTSLTIYSFAGDEIKKLACGLGQVFGSASLIDFQRVANESKRFQRGHGEGNASRHCLYWQRVVEIVNAQASRSRDGLALVLDSEGGIELSHLAERGFSRIILKLHRHFASVQFEHNPFCAALAAQRKCSTESGMTSERQLFLHGEDAHANAPLPFGGGIAGQDEGGLGEVHFLCN